MIEQLRITNTKRQMLIMLTVKTRTVDAPISITMHIRQHIAKHNKHDHRRNRRNREQGSRIPARTVIVTLLLLL